MHVPKEQCSKMDGNSIPHVFLGYSYVSKAYRLWDPAAGKLIVSYDVVFDEHSTSSLDAAILPLPSAPPPAVPSPSPSQPSTSAAPPAPPSSVPPKPLSSERDSSDSSADEDPLVTRRVPRWLYQTVKDSGFSYVPSSSTSGSPRRSTRSRQAFEDNNFVNFTLMSDILDTLLELSSVEEALASPTWVVAFFHRGQRHLVFGAAASQTQGY